MVRKEEHFLDRDARAWDRRRLVHEKLYRGCNGARLYELGQRVKACDVESSEHRKV